MNANIWKKNAVLATVILFVCVAVYLNWSYGRGVSSEVDSGEPDAITDVVEHNPNAGSTVLGAGAETDTTTQANAGEETKQSLSDFFDQERLNRQQARDGSLAILRESSEMEGVSQQAKDETVAALNAIATNALKEAQIESLVVAKGFVDCVAYISDTGADVVVAAAEGKLVSEQVSQIKDIVVAETGLTPSDITIIEAKG